MLKQREYVRKRKDFIEKIIDIIENSEDYKTFIDINKQYKRLIENNNQCSLWGITFFEVYDNKQLNVLIKGLSKIDKSKYKVDLYYGAKKFKDLNYLGLAYDRTGSSRLAEIELIDDQFIRSIEASFAQINNNQAIVVYEIHFNKIMDNEMLFVFVKNNQDILYKKHYIVWYNLDRIIATKEFSDINRMFHELATSVFQAKLMEVVNLSFGNLYKLPSCKIINYPEGLYTQDSLRNIFLCTTLEINDGEQYLIIDNVDQGLELELLFSGSSYRPISFSHLISLYRMNFYYFLFESIDQNELNQKMNKYFNETKKNITARDYKWLVNKIRAINDNKLHMGYDNPYEKALEGWKAFDNGIERKIEFSDNYFTKKYLTIYSECLEHIKILFALQKENLIITIASWTLGVSILGIITTIYTAAK